MSGAEGARGTYEGLAGGEIPDVLFLAFVDPRGVYGADLELRSERDRVRIVLVLHVCLVDRCIRAVAALLALFHEKASLVLARKGVMCLAGVISSVGMLMEYAGAFRSLTEPTACSCRERS